MKDSLRTVEIPIFFSHLSLNLVRLTTTLINSFLHPNSALLQNMPSCIADDTLQSWESGSVTKVSKHVSYGFRQLILEIKLLDYVVAAKVFTVHASQYEPLITATQSYFILLFCFKETVRKFLY